MEFVVLVLMPLIGAVILGIIGAQITMAKGRNGAVGFLLGFFLALYGLLICFLLAPSIENEAQRKVEIERAANKYRNGGAE